MNKRLIDSFTVDDIPRHVFEAALFEGKEKVCLKMDKRLWVGFKGLTREYLEENVRYTFERLVLGETKRSVLTLL